LWPLWEKGENAERGERSCATYRLTLDFATKDDTFFSVKISSLGDSALLIDFANESLDSARSLRRVLSAASALERAKIDGIVEITSAFASVALFLDSSDLDERALTARVSEVIGRAGTGIPFRSRRIEIPVCYDDEFALDATLVENETRLPLPKIIELHASAKFKVACLGFMPGFPYLIGLPPALQVPRLATPRTKVPAGSVAIANAQAGIYPFQSPGGWNIIGRTTLRLFDPTRTPPTLLASGDHVRFRPITRAEFDAAMLFNEK
jgi:inhibitor of KinA